MSNWSHVSAIIRIDDFRLDESVPDFEKLFGKTMTFEDLLETDDFSEEDYLPMGSEGSLRMSVHVNEDMSCIASYDVSIFGDLRDHDDPDELIEWFKGICRLAEDNFVGVRGACIAVENEINGLRTWAAGMED